MNVLHIVNSLEIGGLEKVVVNLTQQMTEVSHTVVCLNIGGELIDEISGDSFVLNNPPGLHFSTIIKIKKIIHKKSIDIVHTHNQGPQFYGSMAAKLAGKPVIHTKHGQNSSKSNRRDYLDRFSSFLTDMIVTVSDDAREICRLRQKIPTKKLVTILNGIDTNIFYRFPDKLFSQKNKPFVIGTVARLSPEKNHACLLDACAILAKKNVNFQLKIVGDGPLKAMLQHKCDSLNLSSKVDLCGSRTDIPDVMNGFDLFILPSLTEGVSLTLLEAMACELPVVATKVGGTPEVVDEGVTGILVPPEDSKALADAITFLINSPESCKAMGANSRSCILEKFSLSNVAGQYLDVYRRALKKKIF